jgi:quercetin dioxygenase-like cupin family protein
MQVINLKNSIQYKSDSIEKLSIMSNQQCSVTLIAMDAGKERTQHIDPYDEAVIVLEGEAEITISGNNFKLAEGDFIIMPEGEPHGLKALSKFKMALIRPQHEH